MQLRSTLSPILLAAILATTTSAQGEDFATTNQQATSAIVDRTEDDEHRDALKATCTKLGSRHGLSDTDLVSSLAALDDLAQGDDQRLVELANRLLRLMDLGVPEESCLTVLALEVKAEGEAKVKGSDDAEEKSFLGANWGLGIGAVFGTGGVDEAEVVNGIVRVKKDSDDTVSVFSEIHRFFRLPGRTQKEKMEDNEIRVGYGPFVAIQSSDDDIIDAFSVGLMLGWRPRGESGTAFGIGIGLVLDPSVQVLGDGLIEGQPLPDGETEIRFKTQSETGVGLFVSLSF